jgi:tRNA-modifying protein YgfZ
MLKRGKFVDVSDRTIVSLLGTESLDLIQRISTNDVSELSPDGSIQTVLTNEKGRIVEVVSVVDRSEEGLLLVGQSADPLIMKQWIEKYIIMEDIVVTVLTAEFTHLMTFNSTENMRDLMRSLPLNNCQVFEETFGSAKLWHIIAPRGLRQPAIEWLLGAGFAESASTDYEEYSIMCEVPRFPNELSASYNPLEARLLHLVSFTKGCYIGQEVVARLDTYKKVQRGLVGMKMSELPVDLPTKIYSKGEECGSVTSAAKMSDSHECLGLGYVKTGFEISKDGLYFRNGENEIELGIDSRGTSAT